MAVRSRSDRLYGALLRLYPADFRRAYGPLMTQMFRDMCRDAQQEGGSFTVARLWLRTLVDLCRSVITEHLDQRGVTVTTVEKIGRYEVRELLGSGAVGAIYRVYDPDCDQERALKILKPDVDRDWKTFIHKQANYLTSLDHPGLPTCYEYVELDDQVYLVMDLIEGRDLLRMLTDSDDHLPVTQVVGWMLDICDVLEYLHAQDLPLIVRDIKPANIMVDGSGRAHLIELGIVEAYEQGREMPKIGTEGYAAPEQYRGESDPRTDVFLLGATLHHLLTRRDPRQYPPFTFAEAPVRELNPAVPEVLEAVVAKAVEFEPDARFQSIAELKTALRAAI